MYVDVILFVMCKENHTIYNVYINLTQTMFGSWFTSCLLEGACLIYVKRVCVCIVVSNIHCVCFCSVLFRLVYPKLSASLDCHFWIALWYSLTFCNIRLTFFPNCIWTPTFSAKYNNLASVVWHTSLMFFFHFNTVTTNFNGEGEIYPYRSLRIVVCPFVPLLSFIGPLYYLSFELRIVITLWYISPVAYEWSSFLVKNKYVVPYFLHSDK
jgi:hypothetical protein